MILLPNERFQISTNDNGRYFDVEEDCFVDYDNHTAPTYSRSELELLMEQDPDKFRKCKIMDTFNDW